MAANNNSKEILDKSSELNRNLGLLFIGFLIYLLITVNGISDLQLLTLDNGVQLPIIGVSLKIIPFAIVTPIVIIGIHLNLILNLREHASKLNHWIEEETKQGINISETWIQRQLHPFLFNYIYSNKGGLYLFLTKVLVNSFTFFLPLVCLYYIQYRFSYLHDIKLSSFQFICFSINSLFVFRSHTEIFLMQKITFRVLMKDGIIPFQLAYRTVKAIKNRSFKGILRNLTTTRIFDQFTFSSIVILAFLNFIMIWCICSDTKYKAALAYAYGENYSTVYKLLTDTTFHEDFKVLGFEPGLIKRHIPSIPRLDLLGEKIAVSRPSGFENTIEFKHEYSVDSIFVQNTKGFGLMRRDFKFMRLEDCEMINADLFGTKLQCAFISANLQNTNLNRSNLQNSLIVRSNLKDAQLIEANLDNCLLFDINMQSVTLYRSNLQSSRLHNVNLRGSNLKYTNWKGASIDSVNFQYSNLLYANFDKAVIYRTNFKSTNLSYAQFIRGQLAHSNLSNADLFRTNFSEAPLNYDTITNVLNLQSSIEFPHLRVKMVDLNGKKIQIVD